MVGRTRTCFGQVEALLEAQSLADKTTAPDWVQEDVRSRETRCCDISDLEMVKLRALLNLIHLQLRHLSRFVLGYMK